MDDTNLLKTLIRYFTDSNSVSLPQEYAILWDQYTSDKPLIVDWHKLNDKLPDPGAITEIMFEEPKRFISILTIAMMEVLNIDRTPDNPIKFEQGRSARISGFEAKSNQKNISALRSADLNRLIVVEGKIKSMTNIFPVIVSRTYTCRLCGAAYIQYPDERTEIIDKPFVCKCASKSFKIESEITMDRMAFTVEEDYEDRPGTEVKSIKCIVSGDLLKVGPAERFIRGNRVRVIGIYLARQIKNKANKDKIELEPFVEVNNVDFLNDTFMDIKITDEDRERIKMIAYRPDAISYLSEQMFSSIYGYPEVKKALICQLFGAPKAQRGHKYTRGDIHVLLIGDPSTSKSTFLQISHMLSLKGAFSSGKSTTAVGITAMVHRDETLGTWIVEAGAFPLSNGGIYALDEADKVSEEDKSSLHEAMESQVVSVTKANIHTSLRCEAGLLAAANPKKGRFDINSDIFSQIDMQPTLVNRFDMVFIFIDRSDATIDGKVADRIFDGDNTKEEITRELFKKYLLIAKELTPELSKEGTVKIKEMYLNIRKANDGAGIPISPRQLESAVRLAKAHARVRLSKAVDDVDIKFAIDMIQYYLSKIAIDKITGCVDVDFIETGMCTSERQLLDVIPKLISLSEKRELNFEEIRSKISDKVDERTLEKAIAKLKQGGDIYEPRPDLYRMTRGGFIE